jgi:tRNA(Ile)-lysidine synthase
LEYFVLSIEVRVLESVKTALADHGVMESGSGILVGLSGGGDSMVLLDVLFRLAPSSEFKIGAAHLNHGLREAADAEARLVGRWMARNGVPFFYEKRPIAEFSRSHQLSIEEAGREARYRFLQKVALNQGYSHIAMGHHRDDNAETVLLFLLRGAGPDGLRGISAARPERRSSVTIIRPLLEMSRLEIEEYRKIRQLPCIVDESNHDPRFIRNRIRNQLLPLLKQHYNPRLNMALTRLAGIFREERQWIARDIDRHLSYLARIHPDGSLEIEVQALKQKPIGMQRNLIRHAISKVKGNLCAIEYSHIADALDLLKDHPQPAAVDLPGGVRCRRVSATLRIERFRDSRLGRGKPSKPRSLKASSGSDYCYLVPPPRPGQVIRLTIPEIGSKFNVTRKPADGLLQAGYGAGQSVALFGMDSLKFPLRIRNVRPGDRILSLKTGRYRKVKDLLAGHGVDKELRALIPLLISGKEILWIAGVTSGTVGGIRPEARAMLVVQHILVS